MLVAVIEVVIGVPAVVAVVNVNTVVTVIKDRCRCVYDDILL